jgi:hypothetical protein
LPGSGIINKINKEILLTCTPFIIAGKINQNVTGKLKTEVPGVYTVTQEGFANYLVFAGTSLKL